MAKQKNSSAKPEMLAIAKVSDALSKLDDGARQRVLRYVADIYKLKLSGSASPAKEGAA